MPKCSPNPVPCAHCTGTWTDNFSWTYSLSSENNPPAIGSYNVTGTITASATDCSVVYQITSGTITQTKGGAGAGTTTVNLTGSNPNPPAGTYCPSDGQSVAAQQSISVGITNDGCDYATGTWSNTDGFSGSLDMSKTPDIPDGNPVQTTAAQCWWDLCGGGWWSVVLFRDTIGSSKSMAGRQAYESQTASSQDNCWYQNSAYPPYGLQGGGWFVGYDLFGNEMDYDYVGVSGDIVAYYNGLNGGMNRVPCTMSAPQTMKLYTFAGSQSYTQNNLEISIQAGQYGVGKTSGNNVQAWRQYVCTGGTVCHP